MRRPRSASSRPTSRSSDGLVALLAAPVLVTLLLLVTFDLDRPTRGLITVPDAPLTQLRASMALPPDAR